jgi:hypothetical protein
MRRRLFSVLVLAVFASAARADQVTLKNADRPSGKPPAPGAVWGESEL